MKKAIVISLVALLVNSAGAFVFAQTLPARNGKRLSPQLTMLRVRQDAGDVSRPARHRDRRDQGR